MAAKKKISNVFFTFNEDSGISIDFSEITLFEFVNGRATIIFKSNSQSHQFTHPLVANSIAARYAEWLRQEGATSLAE